MKPRTSPLFAPERFATDGKAVLELLLAHLEEAHEDAAPAAVMPAGTPAEMCARFPAEFTEDGDNQLLEHIARAVASATKLHDPGFVGHQVATPLPAAALCDLVSSFMNNGMAVFEMGPASSAMERAVLGWMSVTAGFPTTAGGVLTSGGSLGNLTALLAARQASGQDPWRRGLKNGKQLCVFVAETAHYSIARAARILGLGDAGVVSVDVDGAMRMKPDALADKIAWAKAKGYAPMAVVGSAGSTAAGAIDPLAAIADVCAQHGVWFHVDGAHGASLLLSSARREHLHGIERADSIVWDAHKMMMMPALVTAVLFRDAKRGAQAFEQDAGYLFGNSDEDDSWADIGKRTVECTKLMMSLKLYACLRAFGTRTFTEHVDHCCSLATSMAHIARSRDLEVMVEPECNIVCFRPKGLDGGQVAAIRRKLVADGRFYLVQVRRPPEGPHAGMWLRCTLTHPLTRVEDLEDLIDDVVAAV